MSQDSPKEDRTPPGEDADSGLAFSHTTPSVAVGTEIGPYKLLSVLGEGGFGMVYLAEQKKPVRRQVALKVIKPGMDSRQVIARFEAEEQALALLDHPNIAHVFDAGTTENGRPYFAMEHVKGLPITVYCDQAKLTIEERLTLFLQVCEGVQHAHQKGIIHRDLKPSNLLVSVQGEKAVPKIIDFGVAKALSQPLTERTVFTEQGQLIGTPEYMSPEQADVGVHDIDTRSDIYSLGVVLYELLAGVLPFDSKTLRQAAFREIQRMIREEEPPLPSTRLFRLGEKATSVAQNRRTDTKKLVSRLHNELEWIPLRAMRKEQDRRYQTVPDLAQDVQNYLQGAPLLAGPESTLYRLKKSIHRNRALVAGVATVLVVLVGGILVSTLFAAGQARARAEADRLRIEEATQRRSAEAERDKARQAEQSAEQRRKEAVAAQAEAERQARIAKAVNDFLNNDLLASVDPGQTHGREVTVRQVLDAASQRIEGKFSGEPLTEASIRVTLGAVYRRLGEYARAETHLTRARDLCREHLMEDYPGAPTTILGELASLYVAQGRYEESEPLFAEALAVGKRVLGEEHPETLVVMNSLAGVYLHQGRYPEAESLFTRGLEIAKRVLGGEHPNTMVVLHDLAGLYRAQGRYGESEPLYTEALAVAKRVLGQEHPNTMAAMGSLAGLYAVQGRYGESELLFTEALEAGKRVLGEEHPETLVIMGNLAQVYIHQGRYEEAESLSARGLGIAKRILGEEHPHTLITMASLASLYSRQRRFEEAESLFVKTWESEKRILGEEHPETLVTMSHLAELYRDQKRYKEAESLCAQILQKRQHLLGQEHPDTLDTMHRLALLYSSQGQHAEGETLLLKVYAVRHRTVGDTHPDTTGALRDLIAIYEAWGKPDEAQKWRTEFPAVRTVPEENLRIPDAFQACAANLGKIQAALARHEREKGTLPDRLSDLVAEYLPAEALFCPDDPTHKSQYSPDPRLPCSYIWEFSIYRAPQGWDPAGKALNRDWKEAQVRLFGDVVPMVRCNHHGKDKVLNLSRGGRIYWSALVWEHLFRPGYRFGDERPTVPAGTAEATGPAREVNQP